MGSYNGVTNPAFTYDANGNMTGGGGRTITYTPFNMASTVADGGVTLELGYYANHARDQMCVPGCSGTPTSTTYYLYDPSTGGMSEKAVTGGTTAWTDYVLSPEGHIVATRIKAGAHVTWRYTVVDNLGSTVSLTDDPATPPASVVERDSYDPWGKRRNANGTDAACGTIVAQTTRGYTGHEMLDSQCLINMNARLYDPTLGRFQSADSVVPDATGSQSYNRYSYVENNPLNSIDPTGHMVCWSVKGVEHCAQEPGGGPPCWGCSGNGWDNNGDGSDGLGNVTFNAQTSDGGVRSSMTITRQGAHMWVDAIIRVTTNSAAAQVTLGSTLGQSHHGAEGGVQVAQLLQGVVVGGAVCDVPCAIIGGVLTGTGIIGLEKATTKDDESISLFRVVGHEELTQIMALRQFTILQSGMQVKQFWTNESDADWFAATTAKWANSLPISMVRVDVSKSTFESGFKFSDVGHFAVSYNSLTLNAVNKDAAQSGIGLVKSYP